MIGVWVNKQRIIEILQDAPYSDNVFSKMFYSIEIHKSEIFNTICVDKPNVQACNITEKNDIFGEPIPADMWFDIAALLESTMKCSGIANPLPSYYFTRRE